MPTLLVNSQRSPISSCRPPELQLPGVCRFTLQFSGLGPCGDSVQREPGLGQAALFSGRNSVPHAVAEPGSPAREARAQESPHADGPSCSIVANCPAWLKYRYN